ncbi:MAG: hypothetical protein WCK27_16240 [Verrucomicrobiota bacterium]
MLASQGAQPGEQFKLRDFPPSPFDAKFTATTSLETDPALRRVDRDVDFNAVITNQAAMALIADIKELKDKLLSLKSAVNAKDPMLRVYAQYVDTAHDWVMKAHGREFTAANQYFSSYATNQTTQLVRDRAIRLIDMALYTDLASNTNFAPLLKSTFETLSRKSPKLRSSYARNDALIGFQRTAPPKPVTTWEAYVVELDQRYGLVLIKLEQIQSREAIPAEVITGSMYGDLYRTLDDSAQQYVMLNTPEEIQKLQQELIRKVIELSRLQAPPR